MMQRQLLVILMVLGFFTGGFSQTGEESKAKDFIKTLYADLYGLPASKNVDGFMNHISNKAKIRLITFNTENIISTQEMGYALLKHYAELLTESEQQAKLNLIVFNDITLRGDMVFMDFKIEVETYEGDKLIRKGARQNNALIKKVGDDYKLMGLFSVQLMDEEYKGTCYCELDIGNSIVSTSNKEIRVTTFMPAGLHRDARNDLITIDENISPRKVETGTKSYNWYASGIIEFSNPDGSAGKRIGNAKDIKELISILISKELYPSNCLKVKRKL